MTVKSRYGRKRYIAFDLGHYVSKKKIESDLSKNSHHPIRVIQCAEKWCILKCEPKQMTHVTEIVPKMIPGSVSKSTSGNLLTLRKKYMILRNTRPRYIAFTVSVTEKQLIDGILKELDDGVTHIKFCKSGYMIIETPLKDVDKTISSVKSIDPSAKAFLSSHKMISLKRAIANKSSELRTMLFTRQ